MDCCAPQENKTQLLKENKANMKVILWVIIAVLLVFVAFFVYKDRKSLDAQSIGIDDLSSWTADEKMQYEHHGILPARLEGKVLQQKSSGMVGGC